MLVQKHLYHTHRLTLDCGESIPATVGYETYGRLNEQRNNAILVCHPFHANSHVAGKYHEEDAQPGWWDGLVGPGKAIDTNAYFVIAVDALCNLLVRDPMVITTGPATLNPATGRPYGPAFPQVTVRDNVRLQHQLIESLGISVLACVAGAGTGGFQALEWGVTYPDQVQRVIVTGSAVQAPPVFALAVCQAGVDAIQADPAYLGGEYYGTDGPVDGLKRAAFQQEVLSRSDAWITGMWARKTAQGSIPPWAGPEGRFAFQAEVEQLAQRRAQEYDANHYIYTARACILHDIGHGNRGLEVAAQKLRAELLMLAVDSDLLFPAHLNQAFIDTVNMHGGNAQLVTVSAPHGHMVALNECSRLAEPISRFLTRGELH